MTRRTITEAREALDTMTLSPAERREYERALSKHVKRETARIITSQGKDYERLDAQVTEVKDALSQVEDDLYDLEKESQSRDVSARDYRERFDALQTRRSRLIERAMSLQSQVDKFAEVEQDPEAHLDSLYKRYPTIRPDWPW